MNASPNTTHRPTVRCLQESGFRFRRRPTHNAHLCAASLKFRGTESCQGFVWRLNLRGVWQGRQWSTDY
jgi:hypothetical protein